MSKFIFINLLIVAFLLASCVTIERNNPDDPGSENYVAQRPSSSSVALSSSRTPSSSSIIQTGMIPETPVNYKDEIYETVRIGTQIWMAKNLNYAVEGSKCYDNQDSYCKTYGRLYNWEMAMSVCPEGWHLPSDADWNVLMKFVYPSCSDNSACAKAGTRLKSVSGWEDYSGIPKGTDIYGFAALPSGGVYSEGEPDELGYYGGWWSSSEYTSSIAYYRWMAYASEYVGRSYTAKDAFFSIRCVKD